MASANFSVVPKHVGVIMDGNGRWAISRGHKRSYGHKVGSKNIEKIVETLFEQGVEYISLYAFSTENFSRPKEEVDTLFKILETGVQKYGDACLKRGVRLTVSGDISFLNDNLKKVILANENKTAVFQKPVLNICINYGARQELCRAFNLMIKNSEKEATLQTVEKYLYSDLPPLDLIIRTGGEQRLSNFMLWQACYAELYFTDTLWPDFTKEECLSALEWFANRSRRFGDINNA